MRFLKGTLIGGAILAAAVLLGPQAAEALRDNFQWNAAVIVDAGTPSQSAEVDAGGGLATSGTIASGAADSGNPVKVGGVYNSTPPTLDSADRGDAQLDSRGNVKVTISDSTTGSSARVVAPADASNAGLVRFDVSAVGLLFNGSTLDRAFTCPNSAVINVSAAATTQLVALQASQIIRVCAFAITVDTAATTATFVYGTGSNCGTGTTSITGAMRFIDEGGMALSAPAGGSLFRTIAGNALCLTAATGAVTGFVSYVQY